MGTLVLSNIRTRQAMVDYLKHQLGDRLLDSSQGGNILYCLALTREGQRYIAVFKMSGGPDGWGYKTMDEQMQPCYYGCPERILKQSEVQTGGAVKWRADCRAARARQAALKKVAAEASSGDTFTLFRGYDKDGEVHAEVTFLRRLSATYFVGRFQDNDKQYRMRWADVRLNEETADAI